jgi:hypothetical protein
LSEFWDFVDRRDIDKHVTAQVILWAFLLGTYQMTRWGFEFANDWLEASKSGQAISGTEVAAVLAAIGGPWSLLVGAALSIVVKFYFKLRVNNSTPPADHD